MELLAHNGGIDEIALVLGPIAVLGGLLWLANRRALRLQDEGEKAGTEKAGTEKAGTEKAGTDAEA